MLFFPCVVRKVTAHVGIKALNMRHQLKNCFHDIFIGTPQHQKGYIVYVPHRQKIISSCDIVCDDSFSSELAYTSQQYSEAMDMQPAVSYIPYDTSSREKTGNIITFKQFEEENLSSETRDYTESNKKHDGNLTLTPLTSKEEMDAISSCDESDAEPISTNIL